MRKISIIILVIILFAGCADLQSKPESENNFVAVARLGISSENINNALVVKSTIKGFSAELAGIKRGDIIISADEKIITSENALISLMNNKQPGDHVLLVINRNGKQVKFDIELKPIKGPRTVLKIRNLVLENKKVAMAIIVSDVKNSFPNVPNDWADSIRIQWQSIYENLLITGFETKENFSIVDRSRLKQILDEFQFNQSGFVSDKLRTKIGEMTGATHILDISFSRFRSSDGKGKDDIINARLIEIESGKVLAVDQIKSH
jgi:hypothetical protein